MAHSVETERLWGAMHDGLLSFIRRRVATMEDAEDILQDVFVRIHTKLADLKDTQSVTAWIYRIARNAITDYHRKRATDARAVKKLAEGAVEADGEDDDITSRAGEEFSRCIKPLLNELPDPYRQAVTLTELDGMTQKDAARDLGVSLSGMKARVQRGRGKLKDVLLDCCSVELDRRGGLVDYQRRAEGGCDDCDCG